MPLFHEQSYLFVLVLFDIQQLTDALLEVEAEKSTWPLKEKALSESNERVKMLDDEIFKISKDLLEVLLSLFVLFSLFLAFPCEFP